MIILLIHSSSRRFHVAKYFLIAKKKIYIFPVLLCTVIFSHEWAKWRRFGWSLFTVRWDVECLLWATTLAVPPYMTNLTMGCALSLTMGHALSLHTLYLPIWPTLLWAVLCPYTLYKPVWPTLLRAMLCPYTHCTNLYDQPYYGPCSVLTHTVQTCMANLTMGHALSLHTLYKPIWPTLLW